MSSVVSSSTILISVLFGALGLFGGATWYMQKFYIGRTENELDDLGRSYFRIVLTGYLNRLIDSRIGMVQREEVPSSISRDELDRVQDIIFSRANYRVARDDVDEAKDSVVRVYIYSVIIIIILVITGLLFEEYEDFLVFEFFLAMIIGVALIDNIWTYRKKLIQLRKYIIKINDDVTIEIQ